MKAIVDLECWATMHARAMATAERFDAGEAGPASNYYLSFAKPAQLFAELAPACLALLEALKGLGPVSIHALAKHQGRNLRNVQADAGKRLELGLVEKTAKGRVWVPWEEIQIRLTLGGAKAA